MPVAHLRTMPHIIRGARIGKKPGLGARLLKKGLFYIRSMLLPHFSVRFIIKTIDITIYVLNKKMLKLKWR